MFYFSFNFDYFYPCLFLKIDYFNKKGLMMEEIRETLQNLQTRFIKLGECL